MWGAEAVDVGGKRLECGFWGGPPDDGRALVLLHEGLGSVALWRDFPKRLHKATGWPVMAYSRAGHGGSDPADLPRDLDWMTQEAQGVLPEVLKASGVTAPVYVGHSDGASIAAIRAAHAADTVGAVLMAPHFFTEDMGIAEIARVNQAFASTDLPERMAKYHRDPRRMFRAWADVWLDPAFRAWRIDDLLPQIACPVLAMQGRDDQYGTLAQMDALRQALPRADVHVLEACQHVPHLEQPDATLRHIAKFMHDNALF